MIFLKKYNEIWYFLQMFWKDGLLKRIALEYDLSCIIWEDGIFFPKACFLIEREMKDDFSREIQGNTIFSSNVLKRWTFEKNRTGIWSFLYYLERWYFFFECMFFNWTGNERWFFSRNTRKYDIFFKCSEKMVFWKKSHWNMIFLVLSGKMVFFSGKHAF